MNVITWVKIVRWALVHWEISPSRQVEIAIPYFAVWLTEEYQSSQKIRNQIERSRSLACPTLPGNRRQWSEQQKWNNNHMMLYMFLEKFIRGDEVR